MNYPKGLNVRNSVEFVKNVENLELGENEIMVSFDVVGLFPNIPLDISFAAMREFLSTSDLSQNDQTVLMKLSEICMNQNTFKFRDSFFKQKSGASIGNSASPLISDFFMNFFENQLQKETWFPRVWWRYVDDVFAIVKNDKVDETIRKLNSFYPTIQFTKEVEENGKISFLDLKISRTDRKIQFEIFRKPTDCQLFIRQDSYHHQSHQHAAFHSMFFRLFNIPTSIESFNKELKYIDETAKINGFSRKILSKIRMKQERSFYRSNATSLRRERDMNDENCTYIGIPFLWKLNRKTKKKVEQIQH